MDDQATLKSRTRLGRWISYGIIAGAVILGFIALYRGTRYPRTQDATVFANYIGIAPVIEGPVTKLSVQENQLVKAGELLFEVDDRPYQYALEKALSDQAALEGDITNEALRIASLKSAVSVAEANIRSEEAEVTVAGQGVVRAQAEWEYASNNLERLKPLLEKHFVSADDIDKAQTTVVTLQEALSQSQAQQVLAQSRLVSAQAQHEQSIHAVTTLDSLLSQRDAAASAVKTARYNLDHCHVYAPFDARVTGLLISEGAYAHIGQQLFTLIDVRRWWIVANFREGQLRHIQPGMPADVYVMSRPDRHFSGRVESIGFGVTPDADVIGTFGNDLPNIQRTLNWVHLASRYPVRILVEDPDPEIFRVSASAVVVVRKN